MALLVNTRGRMVSVEADRVPALLERGFTRAHHAPPARTIPKPNPREAPAATPAPTPVETRLPRDFPARSLLTAAGYSTLESVKAASERDLRAIKGIGPVAAHMVLYAAGRPVEELMPRQRTIARGHRSRLDPEQAARMVSDAVTALTNAGAKAWMQDGTLLGAVREGNVIAHDRDTDVGVMHDTWTPAAHEALLAAGFKRSGTYNTPERNYHEKYRRGSIRMCVFHYYRNDDGSVQHGIRRDDTVFVYPAEPELEPVNLGGFMILAPHPPEAWLETKYGKDWRTPRKKWDCRKDPANARRIPK